VIHGMSRPIGALFHVPHGISNAMLMAECFDYVCDGAEKRFADMARAIGKAASDDSDSAAARKFVDACKELCDICGIPSVSGYGIDLVEFRKAMPKMAEDAFASGSPSNTIKDISVEDILKIYDRLCK
ncbi:iron-containing alcohol dehydrogenase, partial [human gut metagenome]